MAVPSYKAFVEPILRYLAQHDAPVSASEASDAVAELLGVSGDDQTKMLVSGKLIYRDRAAWGFNSLTRAELAVSASLGMWQLTVKGRELAAAHTSLPAEFLASLTARATTTASSRRMPTAATAAVPATRGDRKAYVLPPNPLAHGGQADVFEARRRSDRSIVVFKRIKGKISGKRMKREIEVQSSLEHINVMPILDWDIATYSWYVMPRGDRVMSQLTRPLPDDLICRIAESILGGLDAGHAQGHPHRDVKPQNVIELTAEGQTRWVIADWGLTRRAVGETTAKLTQTGQFLGSEGFASPEAYIDAHNVGPTGDVYSLGQVIAWATGVDPSPFVSPVVREPWTELVAQLTKQPAGERPQSMAEVEQLLREVCDSLGC